eukprot:gene155-182_t
MWDATTPLPEDLNILTVAQLRTVLVAKGMQTNGTKAVLVSRLSDAVNGESKSSATATANGSASSETTTTTTSSDQQQDKVEDEEEKDRAQDMEQEEENKSEQSQEEEVEEEIKEKDRAQDMDQEQEEEEENKSEQSLQQEEEKDEEEEEKDEEKDNLNEEASNETTVDETFEEQENDFIEDLTNEQLEYSDNEADFQEATKEEEKVENAIKEVKQTIAAKKENNKEDKAKIAQLLGEMEEAFKKPHLLKITGLSESIIDKDIKEHLSAHGKVQSVTFDGTKRDIAVVAMETQEALQAVKAKLHGTKIKSCTLNITDLPLADTLLFVGNLGPEVTREALRKMFEKYGDVDRVIMMRNKKTGESKGYGFVDYRTSIAANAAKTSLGSTTYNGRTLRVDWADTCSSLELMHSKNLFIDRLPRNYVDTALLRKLFQPFGAIKDCHAVPNTLPGGASRGFAFIEYETVEEAEKAQKTMNEKDMQGFKIRVVVAVAAVVLHLQCMVVAIVDSIIMAHPVVDTKAVAVVVVEGAVVAVEVDIQTMVVHLAVIQITAHPVVTQITVDLPLITVDHSHHPWESLLLVNHTHNLIYTLTTIVAAHLAVIQITAHPVHNPAQDAHLAQLAQQQAQIRMMEAKIKSQQEDLQRSQAAEQAAAQQALREKAQREAIMKAQIQEKRSLWFPIKWVLLQLQLDIHTNNNQHTPMSNKLPPGLLIFHKPILQL